GRLLGAADPPQMTPGDCWIVAFTFPIAARRHQVSRRRPCGDVPHAVTGLPGARRAREHHTYSDPAASSLHGNELEHGRGQVCFGRPPLTPRVAFRTRTAGSVHTVTERRHRRPGQTATRIFNQRATTDLGSRSSILSEHGRPRAAVNRSRPSTPRYRRLERT